MLCSMVEENDVCQTLRVRDWLIIVGVAVIILAVLFAAVSVAVMLFSRRTSSLPTRTCCIYSTSTDDPERQPLLLQPPNNHPVMQRTATFYRWDKLSLPSATPVTTQNEKTPLPKQQQQRPSSPAAAASATRQYYHPASYMTPTERIYWHQRRETLLQRYAAA
ncbi:hypothetical protein BDB00DRAFT_816115 [Zychaea mexicana]|uniref:uncharacterized protein n=1 Tax=Zychaea mexicana TaxID=64656 RepID=UPI0022FF3FD5|nr:uncharacterized protein BDB00DRAFT_816115 [Zychaea mexicana]KAI9494862.1 hypothetical protein BDB00DRAFT_816115 [Zychaea mexicana]